MARCRVGYLLALGAAGLFFLSFKEYFSFYILVLALVFPLFSLLVSLPGMLGAALSLSPVSRAVRRGDEAAVELRFSNRSKCSVARLRSDLICVNELTGEQHKLRQTISGGSQGAVLREALPAGHCGMLRWEVTRLRVYDLLGLFSLRLSLPAAVLMPVLPLELPPEPVAALLGEEQNPILLPRPGGGCGEDYDLRPYRPGDPLRSVHWKLSSKVDDLIVRETLEPLKAESALTLDLFGTPEQLDAALDRLDAISRALIEREQPHLIRWLNQSSGVLYSRHITCQSDLRACEWALLSTPAPSGGASLAGGVSRSAADAPLRFYHVNPLPADRRENV